MTEKKKKRRGGTISSGENLLDRGARFFPGVTSPDYQKNQIGEAPTQQGKIFPEIPGR